MAKLLNVEYSLIQINAKDIQMFHLNREFLKMSFDFNGVPKKLWGGKKKMTRGGGDTQKNVSQKQSIWGQMCI